MLLGHFSEPIIRGVESAVPCWNGVAPPAPERSPQTRGRSRMSYLGRVLDRHRAHRGERLLQHVVPPAVPQRRTAQHRRSPACVGGLAPSRFVAFTSPRGSARRESADHLPRRGRVELQPLVPCGRRYCDLRLPQPGDVPSPRARRPWGTARPARDRRIRVAFDRTDLLVLDVNRSRSPLRSTGRPTLRPCRHPFVRGVSVLRRRGGV